jgi:cytidylate kinase
LKIYLDATVEARARRRYLENRERGQKVRYADILRAMRRRDQIDSQRDAAPLRPATDALIIDTTDLPVTQVMVQVRELVEKSDP